MPQMTQSDDQAYQQNIEEMHRLFFDFKKRLDEISHREDELLKELQQRLDQAKIDELMQRLKGSANKGR